MRKLAPLLGLLFFTGLLQADSVDTRIERLLAADESPGGVVFEIMVWQDRSWDWAAPRLRDYIDRLRDRFPGIEFALVSHGAEMFELARASGYEQRASIRQLARLNAEGLAVHVAGDYAKWKRLGQRDFLEFVDVTPSASAQLDDYIKLGFTLIRLEPPHATD